jgi:hypothetical protein
VAQSVDPEFKPQYCKKKKKKRGKENSKTTIKDMGESKEPCSLLFREHV